MSKICRDATWGVISSPEKPGYLSTLVLINTIMLDPYVSIVWTESNLKSCQMRMRNEKISGHRITLQAKECVYEFKAMFFFYFLHVFIFRAMVTLHQHSVSIHLNPSIEVLHPTLFKKKLFWWEHNFIAVFKNSKNKLRANSSSWNLAVFLVIEASQLFLTDWFGHYLSP